MTMGIDQAGMAAGQKAAAAPENRSSKGRSVGCNEADDASLGGFSSLLSSIEAPIEPPSEESESSVGVVDEEKDIKDGSPLLGLELPVDLLALSKPIDSKTGVDQLDPALIGIKRPSQNVRAVSEASPMAQTGKSLLAPADLIPASEEPTPTSDQLRVDAMAEQTVQVRRALGVELQTEAFNTRLESKTVRSTAELEGSLKDAMQAKLTSVADMATRLLEPVERPRGKSFGGAGSSGAEGGWAQYAHHARAVSDISSNLSSLPPAQAQTQVADKVSYWVTQGMQNAELKLDGFGDEPVEVSILLKGGEARVDFRTDQPEVRLLLEGALGQLKDSLQREGVVLTGVTVGGSGTEGDGERQQNQHKHSGPNPKGEVNPSLASVRSQRGSTAVGRALDIFV
jgi:flagellar hook-length control protein FliK